MLNEGVKLPEKEIRVIGAINLIPPVSMTAATGATAMMPAASMTQNAGGAQPFSSLMTDTINSVNQLETQARTAEIGLLTGTGVDVHQAMIATEKASMAFELVLSVRNKAVQAYQSVIGMQF